MKRVAEAASPGAGPQAPPDTVRPSLRGLLALAWPIVVSRSAQVVVGISDGVMVSHLGESALAATSGGSLNAFTFFIFPMGVVFIVSSFASQLYGQGDLAGARRYGCYGLLAAAATQLLGVASIPAASWLLGHLDYAPEVQRLMDRYLAVRLWSAGPAIGMEALANYYGGLGNTRLPMRASVAAMALNLAGNWLLIDGHLGAPALGVVGSALASTLSTWAAFLGLLAVFLRGGRAEGRLLPRLRADELWRTLRFGLPSGINWFLEFLAFSFFLNLVVAGLGTTAVAAFLAVIQLNSAAFMLAFGLASAGAILTGQAIGAGHKEAVPAIVGLTFRAAAAWQLLVGLVYLLAPRLVLRPFAPEGAGPLLEVGARMLMLSSAWQLGDAAATTLAEALRAAGDTLFTMWARVAVAWLFFVPGSWVTVKVLGRGDVAATLWFVAYLWLLAGVLWWRFRTGAWRRVQLLEPAPG